MAQILATIGRHLVRLLFELGRPHLPSRRSALASCAAHELRSALAELGPTFVKLGQILSTRADLLPPVFQSELSLLQDAAPEVSAVAVRAAIARSLGMELTDAFASFSDQPLAAASIGQVHAATMADGSAVAVKVRRPGVGDLVELDLAILGHVARVAAAFPGPLRQLDVPGLVEEFATTMRAELDYGAEGRNADRVRPFLSAHAVRVPAVVWTRTRGEVLTLERVRGTKIDDLDSLDEEGIDRRRLTRTFADAYLSMVFVNGFFHADPHPGNLFVGPDGGLSLVDFGLMGSVSPRLQHGLVELLVALSTRNSARSAEALETLGVVPKSVDRRPFTAELEQLTTASVDTPVGSLRLAPLLGELMSVCRHYRLRLPRELALLVKTVVMCEGLAARLDPGFSLASAIGPFVASSGLG